MLQRADEQEAPLLTISFSKDAQAMLKDHKVAVAKAMIDAGIDAVDELSTVEMGDEGEDFFDVPEDIRDHTLH